jgi:hypothetical protein
MHNFFFKEGIYSETQKEGRKKKREGRKEEGKRERGKEDTNFTQSL